MSLSMISFHLFQLIRTSPVSHFRVNLIAFRQDSANIRLTANIPQARPIVGTFKSGGLHIIPRLPYSSKPRTLKLSWMDP